MRADGAFEDHDWDLVYLWERFSQSVWAANFIGLTATSAREFAAWLQGQSVEDALRDAAAAREVDPLGHMSWQRELVTRWMEFSEGEYYAGFEVIDAHSAAGFAEWLDGSGKRSRPANAQPRDRG